MQLCKVISPCVKLRVDILSRGRWFQLCRLCSACLPGGVSFPSTGTEVTWLHLKTDKLRNDIYNPDVGSGCTFHTTFHRHTDRVWRQTCAGWRSAVTTPGNPQRFPIEQSDSSFFAAPQSKNYWPIIWKASFLCSRRNTRTYQSYCGITWQKVREFPHTDPTQRQINVTSSVCCCSKDLWIIPRGSPDSEAKLHECLFSSVLWREMTHAQNHQCVLLI